MRTRRLAAVALVVVAGLEWPGAAPLRSSPRVDVVRVPNGGVQPDVAVDAAGVIHLVYLAGDPSAADVLYSSSADGGRTFRQATRVNSQPGSAIAVGTIRGAQVALGRDGRVHVVWNGSNAARPKPPGGPSQASGAPLLYSRSEPRSASFEPQRNLITRTRHLDGGSAIAADGQGRVFVAWHGNALDGPEGEPARRVWLSRSADAGATFATEHAISPAETGVCGCCGLQMAVSSSAVHLLYRAARMMVHRDIYALTSSDAGVTFTASRRDAWEVGACPMSSMDIVVGRQVVEAWEHDGQVAFAPVGTERGSAPPPPTSQDAAARRKHPRIAIAADGTTLLVWAVGTGWNRGGAIEWQAFASGTPAGPPTRRDGLPVWSHPAVAAHRDGFVVIF